MIQLACASATDFISIEAECTYILFFALCISSKHLMCLQQQKYGFMLITRNVYKYIICLISNYCEFDYKTYIRLLNYPEIAKMCKTLYRL